MSGQIKVVVLAALLIWLNVPEGGKESARDFYERGLHLAETGEVDQAIEALENAIQKDKKFADAYHQLALLYGDLGTVAGRFKATRLLQKALRLDSKNIQYHLDMAKLALKKTMQVDARKHFNKIIELEPCHSEAYYHLGLFKEEDMLWYKDMISPQEAGIVFRFTDYAHDDVEEANRFFKQAIECDPNFTLPYYHMAFIQHEYRDYNEMANLLKQAITFQPTNKDFYLFLGLAFNRLGEADSAFVNFSRAMRYMSGEEFALFSSTEPLLSREMHEKYALLNADEKGRFEEAFWKQRDPFFMTKFNERILEHYSRFAYANLRFGNPGKGIQGWQTDQGQTYIRFGPPRNLFRTRPSFEINLEAGGNLRASEETWDLGDFTIV